MANPNGGAKPWERQYKRGAWEPSPAFRAFTIYRDLGEKRTLPAAWKAFNPKSSSSRPSGRFNLWCSQWKWVDRTREWDDEIDRRHRETQIEDIEKMRRRHLLEAQIVAKPNVAVAQEILRRISENPEQLQSIPLKDLIQLNLQAARNVDTAHRDERSVRLGGEGKFPEAEISEGESVVSGDFTWPSELDHQAKKNRRPKKKPEAESYTGTPS